VKIAKKQITLQQISTRALWLLPPFGIMKSLIALTDLTAERKIPLPLCIKRYVFEWIPEIVAASGITKVAEVIIVSRQGVPRF
jgi:hypothetical protein